MWKQRHKCEVSCAERTLHKEGWNVKVQEIGHTSRICWALSSRSILICSCLCNFSCSFNNLSCSCCFFFSIAIHKKMLRKCQSTHITWQKYNFKVISSSPIYFLVFLILMLIPSLSLRTEIAQPYIETQPTYEVLRFYLKQTNALVIYNDQNNF